MRPPFITVSSVLLVQLNGLEISPASPDCWPAELRRESGTSATCEPRRLWGTSQRSGIVFLRHHDFREFAGLDPSSISLRTFSCR
ncbi:hypothetical protein B0T26DRAFT_734352 [Lasiosphaeria miniovina]|uniref:Secreted protein n=1 Tax=Lasiosphaeria miniovina TaxID=1954250 RepID=A0AA39ZQJ0_9PEZI|nr:uncharacterized protein B0T26DRAFT_734352 [Lasiosphaeria miniovina]KAK0701713.1 hypothetical protein B0T26DRAFT_734352 [Lasiosphaeria miniovina]